MKVIKTVRIKKEDWAELSKLAALKQLITAEPVPLNDVISDLLAHRAKLGYYSNKDMCKLRSH